MLKQQNKLTFEPVVDTGLWGVETIQQFLTRLVGQVISLPNIEAFTVKSVAGTLDIKENLFLADLFYQFKKCDFRPELVKCFSTTPLEVDLFMEAFEELKLSQEVFTSPAFLYRDEVGAAHFNNLIKLIRQKAKDKPFQDVLEKYKPLVQVH